jgi:ABC-type Fe3+/spermidine/putrescine transport system ATPase subunit
MAFLNATNIYKDYEGAPLLRGVDFAVERGEIASLLGPSGSGKTTLLRIIAGLERAKRGRVILNGKDLSDVPTHRRGIVLMFQEYALFPHKTVADNVAFGLRYAPTEDRGWKTGLRSAVSGHAFQGSRVDEMLSLVGLSGFADRDVSELSGGERQRVALARSLAPEPRLLLLDEPLGALDRNLRERLMEELPAILHDVGVTAVTVTHDQEEAFALADRVILLHEGRVVQSGAPAAVYDTPASRWIARFLGLRNLLSVEVTSTSPPRVETALGVLDVPETTSLPETGVEGALLIHPWGIHSADEGEEALQATLTRRIFHGAYYELEAEINGVKLHFTRDVHPSPPESGRRISLMIDPAALRWL